MVSGAFLYPRRSACDQASLGSVGSVRLFGAAALHAMSVMQSVWSGALGPSCPVVPLRSADVKAEDRPESPRPPSLLPLLALD